MLDLAATRDLARQLRVDSIRATTAAGSGHPTSSMSAADLMAVLVAAHFRLDPTDPERPGTDHLVFSKGHASPLLYALLKALGLVDDAELMSLRRAGSRLEGHPTPQVPLVDAATGSLGQGLAVGVGMALSASRLEPVPFRTWVLLGDSEMAEGSVWESFELGGHYRLRQLTAIIDVNRLGQRGETMLGWDTEAYARRAAAFGWLPLIIDGHDHAGIDAAYAAVDRAERPVCIVARTVKGKGVSFLADKPGWHGKALKPDEAQRALAELGDMPLATAVHPLAPPEVLGIARPPERQLRLPTWRPGALVATREAYGDALKALGEARGDVVALDGEVSNSTYSERFGQAFPDRFFEMYIAEQQLVGAAQGLGCRGAVAFASTFAAFLARAHDQLRMAAISRADLRVCGSHAGVSIGEDGPSQMALEDLALFRSLPGAAVLYPCDAVSTAHLVAALADREGISYLRTTREKTPVIYAEGEEFPIGGSKLLRSSTHDLATIVAAGITVREALAAADALAAERIHARVLDCYSVKPIDADVLRRCADETGHLVVVEDHYPEGGLGEAVLSALGADGGLPPRLTHLAVRRLPGSATPEQQLERHGLSARHIAEAVRHALAVSA
jgi:transketolase